MIEFERVELGAYGPFVFSRLLLPGGRRGADVPLSICKACGNIVGDQEAHVKHHQTPVIG